MKNLWRRRGPPSSKPKGCFVQHAVTRERRNDSSSSDSDNSDSESSYKTSSQLSPQSQNYNVKFNKSCNYNPTSNDMVLSANAGKNEDSIGLSEVNETVEDPRNICASINVPELVKYFDGLELYNGQILTGRATKGKLWETTDKKLKTDDNPNYNNDKKYNNDYIVIHPSSDHTYSKPPKYEKSNKTFGSSNPRKDDFFDNERFRNVCTSRRRRKDESPKSSVVVSDQHTTVYKETSRVTRHDNAEEDNTRTKTYNPSRKYTSVVGPMPHNYQSVIDIAQSDHFNATTKNNDSRLQLNQSVSNFRNSTEFVCNPNPKSSNIKPQTIEVTGGTYVSQRGRGDPMGYNHQQKKDYKSTSACLEDQNKYQRRENWPFSAQSAGLYTPPCSYIEPKDLKNNLLTRPYTIQENDVLLRDVDPKKENKSEGKKADFHNLTYDITSEECSNSLCLRRKHKEQRCQENETEEVNSKISAPKLNIRQSPSHPSVLSIRIDINLTNPNNNVYVAGAKSLDLQKDEKKRKTGKNP